MNLHLIQIGSNKKNVTNLLILQIFKGFLSIIFFFVMCKISRNCIVHPPVFIVLWQLSRGGIDDVWLSKWFFVVGKIK